MFTKIVRCRPAKLELAMSPAKPAACRVRTDHAQVPTPARFTPRPSATRVASYTHTQSAAVPHPYLPIARVVLLVGIGLLSAAALGGAFGWTGPMAYLLVTEVAPGGNPTTPWVWAARPPHDRGAAICAALVFAAGITVITVRGARESTCE
jgi:hypothetical protein